MGSPVTFSGFNQIDWNVVLNALMQRESAPLQTLQSRQSTLQSINSAYATLVSKLGSFESAVGRLSDQGEVNRPVASTSDSSAVRVSASSSAVAGRYDVVVSALARAQVTASATTTPDSDTTTVATSGTMTIGGISVTVTGPITLAELAASINATTDIPVRAAVVETAPGAFRLVLTGSETGAANAFTITNALSGGSGVTFTDTDADGVSGDTAADNAAQAANASLFINNLAVTSASNTLESGIPGVSVTLQQEDPLATVVVTVERDTDDLTDRVRAVVTAYNDLISFVDTQARSRGTGTLANETLLRGLKSDLRSVLTATYGSGTYQHLAEVGIGFTRTGKMELDESLLAEALGNDAAALDDLFASSPATGAFPSVQALVKSYTQSDGFIAGARERVNDEMGRLDGRIADLQERLALRRATLQREFIAADALMSRLTSQSGSLAAIGNQLTASRLGR
jgi:flagellar hook-associated protein 2